MTCAFQALRAFDPAEIRDPNGKWTSTGGGEARKAVRDSLKLEGRANLQDGEKLAGSGSVTGDSGKLNAAIVDGPDGRRQYRLGFGNSSFGGRHDERGPWNAGKDEIGNDAPDASGFTASLDHASAVQLHDDLQKALAEGLKRQKALETHYNSLQADIDRLEKGPHSSAELAAKKAAYQAGPSGHVGGGEYDVFVNKSVAGQWGNIHYEVILDDLAIGLQAYIGVTPHGSGLSMHDLSDSEQRSEFDAAGLRKVIKLLKSMTEDSVQRSFVNNAAAAAGAAAAGPQGGQFATGGGRVTGHGKKPKTHGKPSKHAPAKPTAPTHFGFDAKHNHGAGYGLKGGDPSVRILQADINRLGLTDGQGKALSVDGRFGPLTTSAVKKLQTSLGMKPTGQVDAAFIKKVSAMKSLPAHNAPKPPTAPTARGPVHTHPRTAVSASRSVDAPGGPMESGTASRRSAQLFDRSFALDDIQISRSGDGRTVEAYAAMFGQPYEVRDQHGHYMEVIDRAAFNRTLSGGAGRQAMCLYNHGLTLHGTADALTSVPLGTPLEIKADNRGLLTVTRYNRSALADSVLESIRNGDIKAQSFRGRIVRSTPVGSPRTGRRGELPTITRHELGLTDYGPTPVPVNAGAEIMAVRSLTELIDDFQSLDEDEKAELLRALELSPATLDGDPDDDDDIERSDDSATSSNEGLGAEDPPSVRHSGRLLIARAALVAQLRLKGVIPRA